MSVNEPLLLLCNKESIMIGHASCFGTLTVTSVSSDANTIALAFLGRLFFSWEVWNVRKLDLSTSMPVCIPRVSVAD